VLRRALSRRGSFKVSIDNSVDSQKFKGADISEFKTSQIAQQLTYREHKLFRGIQTTEFLNQAWTQEKANDLSPTIIRYIEHFNKISAWVATEVVFAATEKQRANAIRNFISIATKCYEINNFNSAMEIVAGLNMSSIQRLKRTWKLVSAKHINSFKKINRNGISRWQFQNVQRNHSD